MKRGNTVHIQNDLIELTIVGDQSSQGVADIYTRTKKLIDRLHEKGKPALLLIDVRKVGSNDTGARINAKRFFKLDYDKLAIYGARSYTHNLIRYLIGVRRSKKILIVKNKLDATSWLRNTSSHGPVIHERNHRKGLWLLVFTILLLGFIALTYSVVQSKARIQQYYASGTRASSTKEANLVNNQFSIYFNVLYGFRAFFESSDYVSQKDFHNYFETLDITKRYPGVEAISFVRYVPDSQKDSITSEINADASLSQSTTRNFTITPEGVRAEYFPITYIEPIIGMAGYGVDLGTLPERNAALQKARANNEPTATDTITLIDETQGTRKGFLVTTPVYAHDTKDQLYGFVNVVFDYKEFFDHLFDKKTDTISSLIIRDKSGTVIYKSGELNPEALTSSETMTIGGKQLQLSIQAPLNSTVSDSQLREPLLIVVLGVLLLIVFAFASILLLRSRDYAFQLASEITEDLQASEHRLELMIDSVKDYSILLLDTHGKIASWNQGAQRINGYAAEEIIGKPHNVFYTPVANKKGLPEKLLSLAKQKGHIEDISWRVRKDGTEYWADTIISAIFDEGKLMGYTKVTRDLTVRKYLEAQRDDFIAIATHELRTPITSIKAYAEVLQRRFIKVGNKEAAELLEKMVRQIDKLTKLVSDLLDISKFDTDKLFYENVAFSPKLLLEEIVEEIARTTKDHTLQHAITFDGLVQGDKYRIGQVITNLIENAVKYSPEGTVVNAALSQQDSKLVFSIQDNGIGIPKQDRRRVFDRFYRTPISRDKPGFGLGLYISLQIVKHHGGKIWVESSTNKGSTFYFTLPLGGGDHDSHTAIR